MLKPLIIALKVSLFTILITGFVYPFVIMGISYIFFHKQATGSLIHNERKTIIGSVLIGQNFKNPEYFFSRPSEAGQGYDGTRSGGSNLGPTSRKLVEKVQGRANKLAALNTDPIPLDLLTSSGSGLDPHISPQAAYWQAPNIALKRGISLKRIIAIIDNQMEDNKLYILGTKHVNVLLLNLALDKFFGLPSVDE